MHSPFVTAVPRCPKPYCPELGAFKQSTYKPVPSSAMQLMLDKCGCYNHGMHLCSACVEGLGHHGRSLVGLAQAMVVVVGGAAVLGHVQTSLLLLSGDAQAAEGLEDGEEGCHHGGGPASNHQDTDDLRGEQAATTTGVEQTIGVVVDAVHPVTLAHAIHPGGAVLVAAAVHLVHVVLLGQHTHNEASPHAAEGMHGGGTQGVINLEPQEHDAHSLEEADAHSAGNDGGPWLQHVAAGGDGDEAAQHTVAHSQQVPGLVTCEGQDEPHHTTSRAGQGGGHSGTSNDLGVVRCVGQDHGARVETIPSKPQQHSSKHHQCCGVAGHVHGLAVAIKAAHAGSNEHAAPEAGQTADHVHDARASKINEASAEQMGQGSSTGIAQPAVLGPHPVDNHRVDECSDEERVAKVGVEVEALSHCSGRDCSGGGTERPLEEEVLPVPRVGVVGLELGQSKQTIADEGVGHLIVGRHGRVATICKAVPKQIKGNA
mmetsp:Transcript_25762/g.56125  ORF Transcript_25762/g.56125 Transcript_25762/m.56125 type:complete len:485 (-) Transcript_25762:408-1862(-)